MEASSPALIEKARTAVTDATGRYRIEDLRPGIYAVTFTLEGWSLTAGRGRAGGVVHRDGQRGARVGP